MLHIEKRFEKSLPLAVLYEAPTVELLSKFILEENPGARQWSSLVPLQPNGSRPPFFWIHGENSDAFLPRYLGPDQPVYGLRHQSDDGRPARYKTVKDIAAHYLSEIRSVRPTGPYFLGGYCFGGLVAFEIAQTLRKEGEAVPLLVLLTPDRPGNVAGSSDLQASENPEPEPGPAAVRTSWRAELQRRVNTFKEFDRWQKARYVFAGVSGRIKGHMVNPLLYPATKLAKKIACRIYLGLGSRLPIWLRSFYILNVYDDAVKQYQAESYAGPVVLFKPLDDAVDLKAWQRLAGARLQIHEVEGNHTEVLRSPDHLKIWAAALMAQLQSPHTGEAERADNVISQSRPDKMTKRITRAVEILGAVTIQDMLPDIEVLLTNIRFF
jgi:thioesterase domain-containing protein